MQKSRNGSEYHQKRPNSTSRPLFPDRHTSVRPDPIPYTSEEQDRIQNQLNKVLGPEYVSFRPGGGGQNVSYIEGWKALNLANEIFGFNGWSSELINVQVDFLDTHSSGRVSLGLSVVVRITIRDGTFHEDFGYGFLENAKNKAVAFEKCKKEAYTDALKRCLRCFGNVLGNCLYDKSIVAKMQKVKLPPPELSSDDFHRDPLLAKRDLARQKILRERTIVSIPADQQPSTSFQKQLDPPEPALTTSGSKSEPLSESKSTERDNEISGCTATSATTALTSASVRTAGMGPLPVVKSFQAAQRAPPGNAAARSLTPLELRHYDLDDFDDLFEFSDDLPAENDDIDGGDVDMKDASDNLEPRVDASTDQERVTLKEEPPMPAQVFFTSSKKALDVQKTPSGGNVPVYDHKFVAEGIKRTVDPNKSAKIRRADLPSPYTASQINSTRGPSASPTTSIGKRQLGLPQSQMLQTKRLHKESAQLGKENADR